MRRSENTQYSYIEVIIYEFGRHYYFIERCQQGTTAPAGANQRASENCALSSMLKIAESSFENIGKAALNALNSFDTHAPSYDPWENKELGKQFCGWFQSRSVSAVEKNSRMVQIFYYIKPNENKKTAADSYEVVPYDNCNTNPWPTALHEQSITLSSSATEHELGQAIRKAFEVSTFHPSKK
jgi:hypothetical protein